MRNPAVGWKPLYNTRTLALFKGVECYASEGEKVRYWEIYDGNGEFVETLAGGHADTLESAQIAAEDAARALFLEGLGALGVKVTVDEGGEREPEETECSRALIKDVDGWWYASGNDEGDTHVGEERWYTWKSYRPVAVMTRPNGYEWTVRKGPTTEPDGDLLLASGLCDSVIAAKVAASVAASELLEEGMGKP